MVRKTLWLQPEDPAHRVLLNALNKPKTLQSLRLLNHGLHTGTLENLHSLILVYAPKRLDFDPPGYQARVKLAILDHNHNVSRGSKKGEKASCTTTRLF